MKFQKSLVIITCSTTENFPIHKVSFIHIAIGKRSDAWTSALAIYEGSCVYLAVRPSVGALAMFHVIQKVPFIHIAIGKRSDAWTNALAIYEGS
jgi:hypothetical protein